MERRDAVAIVTGASRGLGFEIAKTYGKLGMRLAITARDQDELARSARELGEFTQVLSIAGDVADRRHAQRLIAETVRRFGGIDVLVNNASELGPSPMPALQQLTTIEFERILAVNTIAPLRLAQLALPYLTQRAGVLINVSSDAGINAYANWGGYGSSKAALEHWSHILSAEIKDSNMRIFVVDPGDMDTHMHRLAEPGADLSHLPHPAAVAPAFAQLLDDPRPYARLEAQKLLTAGIV